MTRCRSAEAGTKGRLGAFLALFSPSLLFLATQHILAAEGCVIFGARMTMPLFKGASEPSPYYPGYRVSFDSSFDVSHR